MVSGLQYCIFDPVLKQKDRSISTRLTEAVFSISHKSKGKAYCAPPESIKSVAMNMN
jgi:hypothetical protein